MLTRDSEPSRIIARIEFKKQKNSMGIEWQRKASVRDMTTSTNQCPHILLPHTFDYGTRVGTIRVRAGGNEIENRV